MTKESLGGLLMILGLIPFWSMALATMLWGHIGAIDLRLILLAYGAVIASFIAGIHWGLYLQQDAPVNLFIHSNIIAVAAWIAVVINHSSSYLVLVGCFGYLLWIDYRLYRAALLTPWFIKKRAQITALAVGALLVALITSGETPTAG
jgi:hypothetical protein